MLNELLALDSYLSSGMKLVFCSINELMLRYCAFAALVILVTASVTLQLAPFDPTKKKKKKKVVIQDSADDSVDKLTEKTESLSGT